MGHLDDMQRAAVVATQSPNPKYKPGTIAPNIPGDKTLDSVIDNGNTTDQFYSDKLTKGYAKDIRVWSNTTATIEVAASDSGTTYIAKRSSSTQTFTLPSASTAGLTYTFINGHVDGMIYIKGQSGDTINCKSNADGTDRVSVSVAATTGIRNNNATNVLGDNITLVSDGITTWWMTAQSGIFSSL